MRLNFFFLFILFFFLVSCCDECGHMPSHWWYCEVTGENMPRTDYYKQCDENYQDSVNALKSQVWGNRRKIECHYESVSYRGYHQVTYGGDYIPEGGWFNLRITYSENDDLYQGPLFVDLYRGDESYWWGDWLNSGIRCDIYTKKEKVYGVEYDWPDSFLKVLYSNEDCQDSTTVSIVKDIAEHCAELADF